MGGCLHITSENMVTCTFSLHVESKATMIRGAARMADLSSAGGDEPEHVPGSAGTAEATGCGSNVRPWRRNIRQPGYRCRQRIRQVDPTRITSAHAQVLTGDTRLSCEALVCLSAVGHAPGECNKVLAKYEAMKAATSFHPLALYHFLKLFPKK